MKISEVRDRQSVEELRGLSKQLRRDLWQAQFDNHTNQLDDLSRIGKLRKQIARVETVIRERLNDSAEN